MFSIAPLGCHDKRDSVFAQRGMNGLMAERQERIKRSAKVLARLLLINAEGFSYLVFTERVVGLYHTSGIPNEADSCAKGPSPQSRVEFQDTLSLRSHTDSRRRKHDVSMFGHPEGDVRRGCWREPRSYLQCCTRAPPPRRR
jgi:hypothetical protein